MILRSGHVLAGIIAAQYSCDWPPNRSKKEADPIEHIGPQLVIEAVDGRLNLRELLRRWLDEGSVPRRFPKIDLPKSIGTDFRICVGRGDEAISEPGPLAGGGQDLKAISADIRSCLFLEYGQHRPKVDALRLPDQAPAPRLRDGRSRAPDCGNE